MRFRPLPRFKKRYLWVLAICLLLVLLPVALLLRHAQRQLSEGELQSFRMGERLGRHPMLAPGRDQLSLTPQNLIANNSFAPLVYRKQHEALAGSRAQLLLATAEDPTAAWLPLDSFFKGASLQVTRQEGGQRQLKKESRISALEASQFDRFLPLTLPPDLPETLRFAAYAQNQGRQLVAGTGGYYLFGRLGEDLRLGRLAKPEDILQVLPYRDGFLARTASHRLIKIAGHGRLRWERYQSRKAIEDMAFLPGPEPVLLLLLEGGEILRGPLDHLQAFRMQGEMALTGLGRGSRYLYLMGEEALLLRTEDGQRFERCHQDPGAGAFQAISCRGSELLLSQKGRLFYSPDHGGSLQTFPVSEREAAASLLLLSDQRFLFLNAKGTLFQGALANEALEALELPGPVGGIWERDEAQLLLAGRQPFLASAELGTAIHLQEALESGRFAPGDLVWIEKHAPWPRQHYSSNGKQWLGAPGSQRAPLLGDWELSGPGRAEIVLRSDAPSVSALKLLPSKGGEQQPRGIYTGLPRGLPSPKDKQLHLRQRIDSRRLRGASQGAAYRLAFWAKATLPDVRMQVALEGLGMEDVAESFRLDDRWRRYTALLVVPSGHQQKELALAFRFPEGQSFFLDEIRLSRADAKEQASSLQTSLLRLGFLPLGAPQLPSFYWMAAEESGQLIDREGLQHQDLFPLERGARLAEEMGANPCLVLTPTSTETELRRLMSYLFAPSHQGDGRIRAEHGSRKPYHERFQEVSLAFSDPEGLLKNDRERQAFVDGQIAKLSANPAYMEVRSQLVFVDALPYTDGVMRSGADYGMAVLPAIPSFKQAKEVQDFMEDLGQALLRDPYRGSLGRPILMRGMEGVTSLRASEALAVVLEGMQSLRLRYLLGSPDPALDQMLEVLVASCQPLQGAYALRMQGAAEDAPVLAYAFEKEGQRWQLYLNLSDVPQHLRLSGLRSEALRLSQFDASAQLLADERMQGRRISILPGGFVLVEEGALGE